MIIDRTHLRWGLATAVATVGVTWLYLANNNPEVLEKVHLGLTLPAWLGPVPPLRESVGATPLGLIYGTVALVIFLFAALLGWRRNRSSWPLGRIQVWLKAHIWLTLFTIPLVLYHCGFTGGGTMTQILLWLYAFVMVSGIWGLTLQNLVPRLMRNSLPEETIFEQIPFIRSQLVARGEAIRQELTEELPDESTSADDHHHAGGTATVASSHLMTVRPAIQFMDDEALPYLKSTKPRRFALRESQVAENRFRTLKLQVPASVHGSINQMQEICEEKRRIDFQSRLHYWLHGWLLVHAPASLLLVGLTIVHAILDAFLYA